MSSTVPDERSLLSYRVIRARPGRRVAAVFRRSRARGAERIAQPVVNVETARAFVPFSKEIGMDWQGLEREMIRLFGDTKAQPAVARSPRRRYAGRS